MSRNKTIDTRRLAEEWPLGCPNYFEQVIEYPVTVLNTNNLRYIELKNYDVMSNYVRSKSNIIDCNLR